MGGDSEEVQWQPVTLHLTSAPRSRGRSAVKFIASTRGVDRHGTRLLPRGCKYDNYMKNPVFIWNHRKHEEWEPEDVIGQAVAVDVSADAVTITIEFDTAPKTAMSAPRASRLSARRQRGLHSPGESPRFADEAETAAYLARGGIIEVRGGNSASYR